METTVHSVLRLIDTPTRTWTRFRMTNFQLMLRKMNLNKTGTTGSGTTVDVPSAEETRLHGLNTLLRPMDHITYDETVDAS